MYTSAITNRFEHNDLSWTYTDCGKGSKTLLAFHGFGQDASVYEFLESELDELDLRLISINLFHHGGNSIDETRTEKNPPEKEEIAQFFKLFLQHLSCEQVYTIGYSLGGRVLLCLLECCSENMLGCTFVAPDGINRNNWYRFSTQNPFGRWLSKSTNKNPKPLLYMGKGLNYIGLLPDHALKLGERHMNDPEGRNQVYQVWMAHRKLNPDWKKAGQLAVAKEIPCSFIFGVYDRVIPTVSKDKLAAHYGEMLHWVELEKGHLLLGKTILPYIKVDK